MSRSQLLSSKGKKVYCSTYETSYAQPNFIPSKPKLPTKTKAFPGHEVYESVDKNMYKSVSQSAYVNHFEKVIKEDEYEEGGEKLKLRRGKKSVGQGYNKDNKDSYEKFLQDYREKWTMNNEYEMENMVSENKTNFVDHYNNDN